MIEKYLALFYAFFITVFLALAVVGWFFISYVMVDKFRESINRKIDKYLEVDNDE